MPEGPEVRRISDVLASKLVGKYVTAVRWDVNSRYAKHSIKGAEYIPSFPLMITWIVARGKCIIFAFRTTNNTDIYMTSKLGTGGHWVWQKEEASNLWFEICSVDASPEVLYYNDTRHQGEIRFFGDLEDLRANLQQTIGLDLLDHSLTLESQGIAPGSERDLGWTVWCNQIRNTRISGKSICVYLMEQKRIAGIGNYLRAEILYACRISPFRKLSELTDAEIGSLYVASLYIIRASYAQGGVSVRTYHDPNGVEGVYRILVYDQPRDPHGNAVFTQRDSSSKSARTIHWVPAMQK